MHNENNFWFGYIFFSKCTTTRQENKASLILSILALGWVKLEPGFLNILKLLICMLYIILFCKSIIKIGALLWGKTKWTKIIKNLIRNCKTYAVYQSFEQRIHVDNFKVSFVFGFIDILWLVYCRLAFIACKPEERDNCLIMWQYKVNILVWM